MMKSENQPVVTSQEQALMQRLGVTFTDPRLLQSALIHSSFRYQHPDRCDGLPSNERLEFLGDAVLELITSAWIYRQFPEHSEGELTHLRASLVKAATLARFARLLDLGNHIRISRGLGKEARDRTPLLADLFEAVLGAIYLDQGLEVAQVFVEPFLQQELTRILDGQGDVDYRKQLQILIQSRYGTPPVYRTIQVSGPDHSLRFTLAVVVQDEELGIGIGSSKQQAAQEAARKALLELQERGELS